MTENLIVYGADCVWWDNIDKVGRKFIPNSDHPLPCCPCCGGVLFQIDEEKWNSGVKRYDKDHLGYEAFTTWRRGKCFSSLEAAATAYTKETGLASGYAP